MKKDCAVYYIRRGGANKTEKVPLRKRTIKEQLMWWSIKMTELEMRITKLEKGSDIKIDVDPKELRKTFDFLKWCLKNPKKGKPHEKSNP